MGKMFLMAAVLVVGFATDASACGRRAGRSAASFAYASSSCGSGSCGTSSWSPRAASSCASGSCGTPVASWSAATTRGNCQAGSCGAPMAYGRMNYGGYAQPARANYTPGSVWVVGQDGRLRPHTR